MDCSNGLDLDLEILKRVNQDKLIRLLEESSGDKDFVIDGELMKMIDRIADAKILRNHGVNKIFMLEKIPPAVVSSQLVYFVRPTLVNVKYIVDHIHSLIIENNVQKYHLICVPRIVSSVSLLMEEEGLFDEVSIHEFYPDFIPLDDDLLSLEMNQFFMDAFLDEDFSSCVSIARALSTLQGLYGSFSRIIGHGRAAFAVLSALKKIDEDFEHNKGTTSSNVSKIGHLLVFDRDADYVSPLLTQLTYEGSLDEHYGIKAGCVELPPDITGQDRSLKITLNSRDSVFDNIRNKHFAGVSSHLIRKARDLQEKKQATSSMTPAQMKDFVSNDLKTIQEIQKSLSLHLAACEGITKATRKDFDCQLITEHGLITGATSSSDARLYIEDCIARQLPSPLCLRLLCLYSITQQGIPKQDYESLASQFVNSYGFHHVLTLHRLKRLGMLPLNEGMAFTSEKDSLEGMQLLRNVASSLGVGKSGHSWRTLTKKLNLIPDPEQHIDLHNPSHISYIFNGAYSPLIPQLISDCLSKPHGPISEILKILPGTTVTSSNERSEASDISRVALVLILGGITYGEIAALRHLSITLNVKIIMASTSSVTGNMLIKLAAAS